MNVKLKEKTMATKSKETEKSSKVIPMHSAPEEKQTPNPAWQFNLDHVHSWAYWDNAFTDEECDRIIEIGNDRTIREAKKPLKFQRAKLLLSHCGIEVSLAKLFCMIPGLQYLAIKWHFYG